MRARHGFTTGIFAFVLGTSLALTLFNLVSEGASISLFGLRLTSRSPVRPFCVAGLAAAVLVALSPRAAQVYRRAAQLGRSNAVHSTGACVAALMVVVIGFSRGSFVAAAADSYGYVAGAELLARGALGIPQEWAATYDWPNAEGSWSPLGFQPSPDQRHIVPTHPPGLSILMAGFQLVLGRNGEFLVVPLAAGIAVLATFWLGRKVHSSSAGALAAILLACSPTLLFHACVPMSDVPATAMWALAVLFSLGRGPAAAMGAGVCAGVAVLIRPNLMPLSIVPIAAIVANGEERQRRLNMLLCFLGGAMPSFGVLALLNQVWYGSVTGSGYPVRELFRFEYFWTNVISYPRWLIETQTPFVFLAPVALLWVHRTRILLAAVALVVALSYAFYAPFDQWTYLRFLLPAFPALLILASVCALWMLSRLPNARAQIIAATALGAVALSSWQEARIKGAFTNHQSLDRFVDIPRYVDANLPENAVFLTRLYSGSIREYGSRLTIRWDVLDPAWLDRAIADLQARRDRVFIVIEDQEEREMFRSRFGDSRWGTLDWPAAAVYRGVETVWLYDVRDLGRARDAVVTRAIPQS